MRHRRRGVVVFCAWFYRPSREIGMDLGRECQFVFAKMTPTVLR